MAYKNTAPYGDAMSGVMDMTLNDRDNTDHQHASFSKNCANCGSIFESSFDSEIPLCDMCPKVRRKKDSTQKKKKK